MGFPRLGGWGGILVAAFAASSSARAEGPRGDPRAHPAVALAATPARSVFSPEGDAPALPSCVIVQGQAGRLDFQIPVASPDAREGAGRCSVRVWGTPSRDRYRAVPFAPESIGRQGSTCPTFSPDGRTAVYVMAGVGLVESRRDTGGWTRPAPLPFSAAGDTNPFLSPDGSRLYFRSVRPLSAGASEESSTLWVAERLADGWAPPRRLEPPLSDGSSAPSAAIAADGTLYFSAPQPGGRGAVDLYRSRPAGSGYGKPENLGITINGSAAEIDGYISPDQHLLVFASDRPGGFGKLDLYVSHRVVGGWSPARNLGRAVNGPDDEFCPRISPDGRLLVFSTSKGILQIDAAVLDDATP